MFSHDTSVQNLIYSVTMCVLMRNAEPRIFTLCRIVACIDVECKIIFLKPVGIPSLKVLHSQGIIIGFPVVHKVVCWQM